MRRNLALTIMAAVLVTACRSEFHASDDTEGDTEGTTTPMPDMGNGTGDGDGDGDGSTGGDGDGDGDGTDMGTDTGTDDPPGPNDPCDPFLAREDIAPCTAPDGDNKTYTCVRVDLMPNPDEQVQEFRCRELRDWDNDGADIGDYCNDNGSSWYQGCQDSQCLTNGYPNAPINFPDGWCDPGVTNEDACCLPYCDYEHPCDQGWDCDYDVDWDDLGVGTCVWPS